MGGLFGSRVNVERFCTPIPLQEGQTNLEFSRHVCVTCFARHGCVEHRCSTQLMRRAPFCSTPRWCRAALLDTCSALLLDTSRHLLDTSRHLLDTCSTLPDTCSTQLLMCLAHGFVSSKFLLDTPVVLSKLRSTHQLCWANCARHICCVEQTALDTPGVASNVGNIECGIWRLQSLENAILTFPFHFRHLFPKIDFANISWLHQEVELLQKAHPVIFHILSHYLSLSTRINVMKSLLKHGQLKKKWRRQRHTQ